MDPSDESRDLRLFLRELTVRHERALRGVQASLHRVEAGLGALLEQSAKHTEALVKNTQTLDTARREIVSELGAQRKALFQILDRLPERGGPGTAGA